MNPVRIAHLMLAHTRPQQVSRLVNVLQHSDADFYIHLDLKADRTPFQELLHYPNVFFVENRVNVRWGAYSMVQATINGFDGILASGRSYHYINLISEQCYPLQPAEAIHDFFRRHYPAQFMEFRYVHTEWHEAIPRLTRYHLIDYSFPFRFTVERWLNRFLPERKMINDWVAVGRSQWFTITPDAVRYIVEYLKTHPETVRFFRLVWGVDEIIFQTILYNSPFREGLVNNNVRYIDWSEGKSSPKTFTVADEAALRTSGKLLARKFDLKTDPVILDRLDAARARTG